MIYKTNLLDPWGSDVGKRSVMADELGQPAGVQQIAWNVIQNKMRRWFPVFLSIATTLRQYRE